MRGGGEENKREREERWTEGKRETERERETGKEHV